MCYNCGCGVPDDDMGDAENITNKTLIHLGEHWGKGLNEVRVIVYSQIKKQLAGEKAEEDSHLKEMFEKAAVASGQTVLEAKKNTLELLQKQIQSGR